MAAQCQVRRGAGRGCDGHHKKPFCAVHRDAVLGIWIGRSGPPALTSSSLGCLMSGVSEDLSFTYFPENYRWSHGLLIGLNMAPWGGAEIGEVNRIGLRLKKCIGDDDAWFREWAREARIVEDRGRELIAGGRKMSGAQYLQRASAYYHVGERFLQPKSAEGMSAYKRGVVCLRDAAK
jgi:hypothetical protein